MMRTVWRPTACLVAFLGGLTAHAQLSTNLQAWLQRIDDGEFRSENRGPTGGTWVDGGRSYTRSERDEDDGREIVRYHTESGEREVLMSAAQLSPPELGRALDFREDAASADGQVLMFAVNPHRVLMRKTAYDYWVLNKSDRSWCQLGGGNGGDLLHAKLSPDGTRAAYVRDNNLYVERLRKGRIKRLTSDGSSSIINGTSDWVNEEEFYLRDGFAWSPDGRRIAFLQFDQSHVPEFTLINNTDTLYPVVTRYHYPKPDQTNSAVRLGIVNAAGGVRRWVDVPGDPRNTYIPRFRWLDEETLLFFQLDRLQHTNKLWLADARTGRARLMFEDRDETWIDVNTDINRRLVWLNAEQRLLYSSERDGWRHAYAISREGDARLVTRGDLDLISLAGVDEGGGQLYFIASPENATQRYLYRSRLDGTGEPERLTPSDQPGTHTYDVSPNGQWAFHRYSRFDDPGVSDLIRLPDHDVVRVFQDHADLKEKVKPILAGRTEFLRVTLDDGVTLDGWLIRPSDFDPSLKYPLIVTVYGEPAGTTVTDNWRGSRRLITAALADDGYLVASFDNRGTPSPKGRAWRKVVYGAIGELASIEQAAAVRALAATRPYVDLERVGVYGWSGGGSMTLNLMFRSPELFKVGVAGAPVPDQTLYNSIYQERYMGLPSQNPDGYRAGSPIHFADGLEGKLLIIHGTGDDNVHFQGTQRLLNKLIELKKQFSFMEYPNRRHGIGGRHIDTLRYGFLQEHLPAGGR